MRRHVDRMAMANSSAVYKVKGVWSAVSRGRIGGVWVVVGEGLVGCPVGRAV